MTDRASSNSGLGGAGREGLPPRPSNGSSSGGMHIKGSASKTSTSASTISIALKPPAARANSESPAKPRPRALDLGFGSGPTTSSDSQRTGEVDRTASTVGSFPETPLEEGEVRLPNSEPASKRSVEDGELSASSVKEGGAADMAVKSAVQNGRTPESGRSEAKEGQSKPRQRSRSLSRAAQGHQEAGPSRSKAAEETRERSDRRASPPRRRDEPISSRRHRDDDEPPRRARDAVHERDDEDAYGRKRRRSISPEYHRRDRSPDRRKRAREDRSPPAIPPPRRRYDDDYRYGRGYDSRDDVLDYEAGSSSTRDRERDRRDDRSYRSRDIDRERERERDRDRYDRREYDYRESKRRVYDNDEDRYQGRDERDRDPYRYPTSPSLDRGPSRAHGYDRSAGDHWESGGPRRGDARGGYDGHANDWRDRSTRSPSANGYGRNPYADRTDRSHGPNGHPPPPPRTRLPSPPPPPPPDMSPPPAPPDLSPYPGTPGDLPPPPKEPPPPKDRVDIAGGVTAPPTPEPHTGKQAPPLSKPPSPSASGKMQKTKSSADGPVISRRSIQKGLDPAREEAVYGRAFQGIGKISGYLRPKTEATLGKGTFGLVTVATRISDQKKVALKLLQAPDTGKRDQRQGILTTALREIKLLKILKHENIVELLEIVVERSQENGQVLTYLVFPYMDHDLCGLLKNKAFDNRPRLLKLYMLQLLEGVAYMHHHNIIHRDLKSANILIDNHGSLQIADFGLARPVLADAADDSEDSQYTNMVVTRWYRAPELFMGETFYGPEIDIWSIGCIFAEMYQKHVFLVGASDPDQLAKIFHMCGTPGKDYTRFHAVLRNNSVANDNQKMDARENVPVKELVAVDLPRRLSSFKSMHSTPDFVELLDRTLVINPAKRPTAVELLNDKFFYLDPPPMEKKDVIPLNASKERRDQLEEEETRAVADHHARQQQAQHAAAVAHAQANYIHQQQQANMHMAAAAMQGHAYAGRPPMGPGQGYANGAPPMPPMGMNPYANAPPPMMHPHGHAHGHGPPHGNPFVAQPPPPMHHGMPPRPPGAGGYAPSLPPRPAGGPPMRLVGARGELAGRHGVR